MTGHAQPRTHHPDRSAALYRSEADVSALRAYLPELSVTAQRDASERTVGSLRKG